MQQTILITGSTDGMGQEAAKGLAGLGHNVLIHGRNSEKLQATKQAVEAAASQGIKAGSVEAYLADFTDLAPVDKMADEILAKHDHLDVLINNAGILKAPQTDGDSDVDIRLMVNLLAPYRLTERLLPILKSGSRVINLSSAAQSPVSLEELVNSSPVSDMSAYAQSKLALTMWSSALALQVKDRGIMVVSVNPGSLINTKMVRNSLGAPARGLDVGRDILMQAALSDKFKNASGRYFDNDRGDFGTPHPHAQDLTKSVDLTKQIAALVTRLTA